MQVYKKMEEGLPMRKHSFAFLLAVAVLLSLLVPAMAASPTLTLRPPDKLPAVGESFTVTVEISGNPGICTAQLTLGFDSGVVDCTEVTAGSVLDGMLSVSNPDAKGGAKLAGASATPVSGNGTLAEFRFKVLKSGEPAFTLKEVLMCDESGTEQSFTVTYAGMSAGGEITPSTPPTPTAVTFPDTKGHWCEKYAARASEMGLFKGYADGSFHPDDNITRAQFVTVLYRMASGSASFKAPTVTAPFKDIAGQSEEFRRAITWAYAEKLVSGRSETVFDPEAPITRQEAMKVLFAYSGGQSGMEMMFTRDYDDAFTDSGSIASWAKPAVYWAYYHELISGTSSTTITPTGLASRGQLAKILVNYSEKFGN